MSNKQKKEKMHNNNINIAELLMDAPRGTKLYSPLYGEVELDFITDPLSCDIVVVADGTLREFNNAGRAMWNGNKDNVNYSPKCLLFPSNDCRTWENFEAPWRRKHFEPFQKVLVPNRKKYLMGDGLWAASFYSHYSNGKHVTIGHARWGDEDIIPYEDKAGKEVEA